MERPKATPHRELEATAAIRAHRSSWSWRGQSRPAFATAPGPGQESVWDYPRPPRIAPDERRVVVSIGDRVLVESTRAVRVLETAGPPTFYLPRADVRLDGLRENDTRFSCEWKGVAVGLDWIDGRSDVGWTYLETFPEFHPIAGWLSFYPGRVDCFVDGERVRPQPGGYYGGWITNEIIGPFKGEAIANGL